MSPKNTGATPAGDAGTNRVPGDVDSNTDNQEKTAAGKSPSAPRAKTTAGPVRQTPPATRGLLLRQDRSALSQLARRQNKAAVAPTPDAVPATDPARTEASITTAATNSVPASRRDSTLASGVASTRASESASTIADSIASDTASTLAGEEPVAPARQRGRRTTPPAPAAASHPGAGESSSPPASRTPKKSRTRNVAASPAAGTPDPRLDEKKAVTFYIDTALRKRLKLFADKKHMSQTLVTLHALSLPDAKLAELVTLDQQSQVVESLDRFGVILKSRGDLNDAKQQVGMRMTPRQLQVIDELRDKAGARDRSHLINLALREYLDQN